MTVGGECVADGATASQAGVLLDRLGGLPVVVGAALGGSKSTVGATNAVSVGGTLIVLLLGQCLAYGIRAAKSGTEEESDAILKLGAAWLLPRRSMPRLDR